MSYFIKRCPVCKHPLQIHTKVIKGKACYQIHNHCRHFSELETKDFELPGHFMKDWNFHNFTEQELDDYFGEIEKFWYQDIIGK